MREDAPMEQLPQVEFTPEQENAFKPYCDFIDEDGIVKYGKYQGSDLDNVPREYLEYRIRRNIAEVIVFQRAIYRRSSRSIARKILEFPGMEEFLLRCHEHKYGSRPTEEDLNAAREEKAAEEAEKMKSSERSSELMRAFLEL